MPCDKTRQLLSLPARHGGLGIANPVAIAADQHKTSAEICQPVVDLILGQDGEMGKVYQDQLKTRTRVHLKRRKELKVVAEQLVNTLPRSEQRCAKAAVEQGASTRLTAVPLVDLCFVLHKRAFTDALCLRYS